MVTDNFGFYASVSGAFHFNGYMRNSKLAVENGFDRFFDFIGFIPPSGYDNQMHIECIFVFLHLPKMQMMYTRHTLGFFYFLQYMFGFQFGKAAQHQDANDWTDFRKRHPENIACN